jgi:hypothetical protein
MNKIIEDANRKTDEAYRRYYKYIKDNQEKYTNIELCRKLGQSDKYIFMILKRGNFGAMKRLANLIADMMSADKGTNSNDSGT